MYYFDYRMIEGSPLHYSYYPPEFGFYPKFQEIYFRPPMEEELIHPSSPNSTQSDSDNSLSSIEVSPKPIRARTVIQHTPKNDIRCGWKNCGILFETLDQLATHVTRVHAASGPGGLFYCGWEGCARNNKGFNARYKMLVHVRTHTNEKPHRCFLCNKSFSRAENLKIHTRSHSGEKPYVCPVPGCNKAYSNSSDRFKHTRTHQVEKPYQCKVPGCIKRYTDPSSLRKHVKTYKHFVDNNKKVEKTSPEKVQLIENEESHSCDCTHMCCSSKYQLIDMKENKPQPQMFVNYFKQEQSMDIDEVPLEQNKPQPQTFVNYIKQEQSIVMDELPLDLSINREIV